MLPWYNTTYRRRCIVHGMKSMSGSVTEVMFEVRRRIDLLISLLDQLVRIEYELKTSDIREDGVRVAHGWDVREL